MVSRRHVDHLVGRGVEKPQLPIGDVTLEEPPEPVEPPTPVDDLGATPAAETQKEPTPSYERPQRERRPPRYLDDFVTK